ncbi:MBL fold metallo-hydrolase RNA specificity domain-containing protein [Aquiflexum sp.]
MTFLVHGEKEATESLSTRLKEELDWNPNIPEYLESFELFDGI